MSTESKVSPFENLSREEIMSALFANMVFQSTNMTLMLLGRVPHPESGKTVMDLEAARMFIDQLEMIQVKTKGNLSKEEEKLLQQSLTHVRLAFVETASAPVEKAAPQPAVEPASTAGESPAAQPEQPAPEPPPGEESAKKFSKKY